MTPIDWPARSLKPAIERRALVTMGFWPLMAVRSLTAPSMSDGWAVARPTPMLMTILSKRGACMMLVSWSCSMRRARISSW